MTVVNEDGKPLRGDVVPVHARYDQVVEIHWRLKSGKIVRMKFECPAEGNSGESSGEQSVPEVRES